MSVREADDPVLFARVQQQNLLRQYDLLWNCIEIALMCLNVSDRTVSRTMPRCGLQIATGKTASST
jgi:hypothetical protein